VSSRTNQDHFRFGARSSYNLAQFYRVVSASPILAPDPRIDVSGRLANRETRENRCGDHVGFNHATWAPSSRRNVRVAALKSASHDLDCG
jgi:hypothetical protein